ncbi:MAG: hypothetical protein LBC84_09980 [Prevotellaceae bacterium]|jgi:multidrug efflux pump subunit AcrA (membrane-fusion protein)|nr:hypothetical protein [Prevotellaceae bacterium]
MVYNKRIWIVLLPLMLSSCGHEENISTYTAVIGNFTHSLLIEGIAEPVRSTLIASPRGMEGVVTFLVEDGIMVEEGQVVCIIESQDLQNTYDQLLISLENAQAGLNKTKADLNMQFALLEAQVRTNEADTKISLMDSLQLAFLSENQRLIKELELERTAIEKVRFEKKLEALKVIQQSEIKKLELEIQRYVIRLESLQIQIGALTLKAPSPGMVVIASNPLTEKKVKVGDPVWSNFPIANLPQFQEMKVKILAPEADFKMINVNDSVCYTFDAMPGVTGTGKILKKAPMGQPYKRGGTVKFFEIEASLQEVESLPEPGFTVNCCIIIKHIENVISIPQIALFDEDSVKVVYVQNRNRFEKRQVLLDISSQKEAIVTAGLNEGDVITLSKPKPSLIKSRKTLPDSLFNKTNP